VIVNLVQSALPLNLEKSDYLKGDLWIHAIDHVAIGSDSVGFEMNIQGKNIQFGTRLGNQVLKMDVGNFNVDYNCRISLRYDTTKRLLYVTPYLLQTSNDNLENKLAANLLQLISLANGVEYPVEIARIEPVLTRIGRGQFHIDMDITNIYTEKGRLLISGRPKLEKLK
jgi:hypothetical protein